MRGSGVIRRVGSCGGVVVRSSRGMMSCHNMVWFGSVVGGVHGMLMMGRGRVM